jgi:GH24 family phage-related lysozyme (muramidase)
MAPYYKKYSTIRMPCSEIKKQLSISVSNFYTEIKIIFPKFDSFPYEAKLACMDMIFNLGMTGLNREWPKFKIAVRQKNWRKAATESYRYQVSKERNNEIRSLFLKAHEHEQGIKIH